MIKKCKRCGLDFVAKVSSAETCPYKCRPPKKRPNVNRKIPKSPGYKERTIRWKRSTETVTRESLDRGFRHRYNITIDDFDNMIIAQDGRCAICNGIGDLVVDHDHATGRVRGLLCFACNAGLGMFRDSVGAMRDAAKYVEDSRGE